MAETDSPQQPPAEIPGGREGGWHRRGGLWACLGSLAVVVVIVLITVVANTRKTTPTQPTVPGPAVAPHQPSTPTKQTPTEIPAIRLKGKGKQAAKAFTVTDGLAIFRSTCSSCSANFVVELLDSSGQTKDLLVNAIGKYDGSKGAQLSAGRYRLNITADAAWSVTVTQPRDKKPASLPQTYTGKGDRVKGPFKADHAVSLRADNRGEGNFIIVVLDADGDVQDLPFNEIGTFSGSRVAQMFSDGPYYLNVTSDGTWKLKLSTP